MPLDRTLRPLARFFEAQRRPMAGLTADEVRTGMELLTGSPVPPHLRPPSGGVEDVEVAGRPARVYRPVADGPTPTVVFFHGGGFVLGSTDTHDGQLRELAARTGATYLSVDYRLAPEHVFPAAVEDAYAAVAWALEQPPGGDADRVAVAGDSAGATLAAVAAQRFRDRLSCCLLLYPAVDFREDSGYASAAEHAEDGVTLTTDLMAWFRSQYIPAGTDRRDPRLSPLFGDLAGLPPTLVTVAEFDPLADQGRLFARELEEQGNTVRLLDFPGLIHGYFSLYLLGGASEAAVQRTCEEFAALL